MGWNRCLDFGAGLRGVGRRGMVLVKYWPPSYNCIIASTQDLSALYNANAL